MSTIMNISPSGDLVLEQYNGEELEVDDAVVIFKSKYTDNAVFDIFGQNIERSVKAGAIEILYFLNLKDQH